MPGEYFPRFHDSLEDEMAEQRRMRIIHRLSRGIDQHISALQSTRPSHPQTEAESNEIIVSGAREMQLRSLSLCVFEMSMQGDETSYIDLDYLDFAAAPAPVELPNQGKYTDELQVAAEKGELLGTKDFLSILAPFHVTDPNMRDIYFSRWKRNLLQEKYTIHENTDGSAITFLETALPNIGVLYHYPPHREFPDRTLRLMYME